jgi:addiction module HigA family antidote
MLLEEFLKPLNMTQTELAERIGVPVNRVNEIVKGKRGVTTDTALRLGKLFGMDAQFWLNLQLAWDLYEAIHSRTSAEQLARIRQLTPGRARRASPADVDTR